MTQPNPPVGLSPEIEAMINSAVSAAVGAVQDRTDLALEQMRSDHAQEIAALNTALQAARAAAPIALVPEHGGGFGTDVHETWSFAEQTAARAESERLTAQALADSAARAEARRVALAEAASAEAA